MTEFLFGIRPVRAALIASKRKIFRLLIRKDLSSSLGKKTPFEEIESLARAKNILIERVGKAQLGSVCANGVHQGVVIEASPLKIPELKELPDRNPHRNQLWVGIDGVTDPQNFGSLIRSCYFFGASGVFIPKKNSSDPSPVASKASSGALELMELGLCHDMASFLRGAKRSGWKIFGTTAQPSTSWTPFNQADVAPKSVLLLGSEGSGLQQAVLSECDSLLSIPCFSQSQHRDLVGSLNVGVAGAVLFHHFLGTGKILRSLP